VVPEIVRFHVALIPTFVSCVNRMEYVSAVDGSYATFADLSLTLYTAGALEIPDTTDPPRSTSTLNHGYQ
jgi:hypothetical protein